MSVAFLLGAFLVVLGGICDLFGAIGLLKFPNFYVRLHAATVGTIGGAVVPLFGVSMLALGAGFPHSRGGGQLHYRRYSPSRGPGRGDGTGLRRP